jgi:thioredoxin reductase
VSRYDAIVIGGSYAGLSAATMLARSRRSVLVIDSGMRRNRFAAHSHGVLAQDGRPGDEIVSEATTQLARYATVQQIKATAVEIGGSDGDFLVQTGSGDAYKGRKILLATGVRDQLPRLPGLAERWGRSVFHCPYCHGYEIGGGPIGVMATSAASVSQAVTVADWGDVTLFAAAPYTIGQEQLETLCRRGVAVDTRPIEALEGPLDGPIGVRFSDGTRRSIKALFLVSNQAVSPLAQAIGCAIDDTPHGALIRTGDDKQTSIAGIYAAGDTARLPTNVTLAAADGVLAGASIHQALIADAIRSTNPNNTEQETGQ